MTRVGVAAECPTVPENSEHRPRAAAFAIPEDDWCTLQHSCNLQLPVRHIHWVHHEYSDESSAYLEQYCGAVAWLPRGLDEDFAVLCQLRSSLLPQQSLVAVIPYDPSPIQCYRLLEAMAEVITPSSETGWQEVLEQFTLGQLRIVSTVHDFCAIHQLSRRESLALFVACAGLSKVEAYEALGCSASTLDTYWRRVFLKMGIRSIPGVLAAVLQAMLRRAPH